MSESKHTPSRLDAALKCVFAFPFFVGGLWISYHYGQAQWDGFTAFWRGAYSLFFG